MKRIIYVLLMTIFCSRLLSGCGQKAAEEPLAVYSFSGENEMFSILNGVAVLNSGQEIFYGGDFREKSEIFTDITAYAATLYIAAGDKERELLSNSVEDLTGETINIPEKIGKVSGDILKETEVDELQNNLFFKLEVTHLDGKKDEYQLQLTLTDVTERDGR